MQLLELRSVLLLQATDLVHVDRIETGAALLLIGGQLLLADGLHSNSGVAYSDNHDTSILLAALVIMLVGERNVDLGNVLGRVRRRIGVSQHGSTAIQDNDARPAVCGCYSQAAGAVGAVELMLNVVVLRETLIVHLLLGKALSPHHDQDGCKNKGHESQAQKGDHQVHDAVGIADFAGHDGVDGRHDARFNKFSGVVTKNGDEINRAILFRLFFFNRNDRSQESCVKRMAVCCVACV